jgi:hypothetical protein
MTIRCDLARKDLLHADVAQQSLEQVSQWIVLRFSLLCRETPCEQGAIVRRTVVSKPVVLSSYQRRIANVERLRKTLTDPTRGGPGQARCGAVITCSEGLTRSPGLQAKSFDSLDCRGASHPLFFVKPMISRFGEISMKPWRSLWRQHGSRISDLVFFRKILVRAWDRWQGLGSFLGHSTEICTIQRGRYRACVLLISLASRVASRLGVLFAGHRYRQKKKRNLTSHAPQRLSYSSPFRLLDVQPCPLLDPSIL